MSERKKIAWRIMKLLFGLAVVAAIGWRFAQDLSREELRAQSLQHGWLLLAGVLYLAALALIGLIGVVVFCYVDLGLVSGRLMLFAGILLGTVSVLDQIASDGGHRAGATVLASRANAGCGAYRSVVDKSATRVGRE